ncbi:LolA family protein [Streptomyces sp. NPDC003016]
MAPNDSAQTTDGGNFAAGRRKAARYIVPVAVAGVAAATIGLVPALADSGDPDLPKITAQQLVEKIAASDTQHLSGTVKISTDLGIPSLDGIAGSLAPQGGGEGSSADPQAKLMELASGTHTLRVAADGPDKQRVSVLDDAAEYSLMHNAGEVWAYDSASNEAFHTKAPADARDSAKDSGKDSARDSGKQEKLPEGVPTTPKGLAEEALKAADDTTAVTVDGTTQVAGRDAYQLLIRPEQSGSTIGSVRVAVDAENGVPLKFTLTPSSGGKAAIDVGFTKVDFGKPSADTFTFTPPKGTKVTEGDDELKAQEKDFKKDFKGEEGLKDFEGLNVVGEGWTSVAEISSPGGAAGDDAGFKAPEKGDVPPEAEQFMDALGDKVSGEFGSGTVFETRLVNALMTDDGKVYVGAVTKDALVRAADAAK